MKINLSGKIAIVTGSTAGIGFAIARGLAEVGAEVVVNGRTAAAVEQAVARLASEAVQARIHGAVADVGSAAGCAALCRHSGQQRRHLRAAGLFRDSG